MAIREEKKEVQPNNYKEEVLEEEDIKIDL